MKKYRVTNLHPILKEGLILTCEETVYGAPAYSLTTADGVESPIAFMHDLRVESHPTWYEEVKPERWRAAEEGYYWIVDYPGTVSQWKDYRHIFADESFKFGNYFRTKEQAEEAAKRVRACLMEYQEELTKE